MIARENPVALAERDIANGRFRMLTVSHGWGQIPRRWQEKLRPLLFRRRARELLAEFGDVIGGAADTRARQQSHKFAAEYNMTLLGRWSALRMAMNNNRRHCPVINGFQLKKILLEERDGRRRAVTTHNFTCHSPGHDRRLLIAQNRRMVCHVPPTRLSSRCSNIPC
jgi:hypothetical protein